MMDEELALLDRWCAGDNTAGNALFKRHYATIYRFFVYKVDADVDDLAQETFLACVRQRHAFARQSTFRTYLLAIARHTLYGYLRKRALRGSAVNFDEISIASLSTSACGRVARHQDQARLLDALRELPLEQQLLLELHYWEELEREQLAEVFDIELATTRSRLFRARQALRERWASAAAEPTPVATSEDDLEAWARSLRTAMQEVRNAPAGADTTTP